MAFIRSLFCISGRDNAVRFILISVCSYLLLCATQAIFVDLTIPQAFFAIIAGAAVSLSAFRRCQDAGTKRALVILPIALFLIASVVVIAAESGLRFIAIVPGLIAAGISYLWPARDKVSYIQGYFGPVDLTVYQTQHGQQHRQQRVEPSMFGAEAVATEEQAFSEVQMRAQSEAKAQGAELYQQTEALKNESAQYNTADIEPKDLSHLRKPLLIGGGVLTLLIMITVIFTQVSFDSAEEATESTEQVVAEPQQPSYQHSLEMPDNFTLMIDNNQAVTVFWQADEVGAQELWSLKTALGDQSCSIIDFDRGKSLRTISVDVETGGNYYAHFSPLDSAELIKSIAGRNSFKLCGYSFSLKGSQAKLTYDPVFEPYL